MLLDGCVERDNGMSTAVLPPREANVAHDADEPTTRDEGVETLLPDLVQFDEELFVVGDVAELTVALAVFLERPVRRTCEHQVDTLWLKLGHVPTVTIDDPVSRRDALGSLLDGLNELPVLGDAGMSR